jgi:hypothetical protein
LKGDRVNVGDKINYDKNPIGEYKSEYVRYPLKNQLTQEERLEQGRRLRATNYNLGNDKGNYETATQRVYLFIYLF